MGLLDDSYSTLLTSLRTAASSPGSGKQGFKQESWHDRTFDLLDNMERGFSRETLVDVDQQLQKSRRLLKFEVTRSIDRREYWLHTSEGEFLMFARLAKDAARIELFVYDPCEENASNSLFDPDLPAYTLSCDASLGQWRLCQEHCDICRHAPGEFTCTCTRQRRETLLIEQSKVDVGDGVNHSLWVSAVSWDSVGCEWQTHTLVSRMPTWNEAVGSLVLDFGSRNVQASAKNFQLTFDGDEHRRLLCQFGKIENDKFALDFRSPLSIVQAFSLSLSTIFWQ